MIQSGIYKITNIVTGIIYIGSAVYIKSRWSGHKWHLKRNSHTNAYLQNAWNKYGELNFKIDVLEYVEDKSLLKDREQYYLDLTNCCDQTIGYNLKPNAHNNLGYKYSAETKAKMSAWQVGRKMSDEARANMSKAAKGKKKTVVKPITPETRAKMVAARVGVKFSDKHKRNIGRKHRLLRDTSFILSAMGMGV